MTRLLAAGLVLVAILSGSLYSSWWMDDMTGSLIVTLEEAQDLTERDDWASAIQKTKQVRDEWDGHSFALHALMRHTETDEIWVTIHEVLERLEQQDDDLYSASNAQLITQLELLAEIERPSLENVL